MKCSIFDFSCVAIMSAWAIFGKRNSMECKVETTESPQIEHHDPEKDI